eukprot:tig00020510_g9938.t1
MSAQLVADQLLVYLVHVRSPTPQARAAIEAAAGVRLGDYVPNGGYLVACTLEQAERLLTAPGVTWVDVLQPEDRVALGAAAARGPLLAHTLGVPDLPSYAARLEASLREDPQLGAGVAVSPLLEGLRVYPGGAPAARLAARLAEEPLIVWIEVQRPVRPQNAHAATLLASGVGDGEPASNALWSRGLRGQGQVVGVVDDVKEYQLAPGAVALEDPRWSHGTLVAATVAGRVPSDWPNATQRAAVGRYDGVAPEAAIVFHGLLAPSGTGEYVMMEGAGELKNGTLSPVYEAGARVVVLSWGCNPYKEGFYDSEMCDRYSPRARDIDEFALEHPDFLVFVAVGNYGLEAEEGTLVEPATCKNCVAVGASHNSLESWRSAGRFAADLEECRNVSCSIAGHALRADMLAKCCGVVDEMTLNEANVYYKSSRGSTRDGRIKPDLLAPGFSIVSARSDGNWSTNQCTPEAALTAEEGTSFAAPALAGLAVLVRQYFVEGFYPSGVRTPGDGFEPSGALVRAVLHASARMLDGVVDGIEGEQRELQTERPNDVQGWGRPVATDALYFEDSPFSLWVHSGTAAAAGETFAFCVDAAGAFRAVLVYIDPPAAPNSQVNLVNDLDLLVQVHREGILVYPNGLTSKEKVNVVERTDLPATTRGPVTVSVNATEVNRDTSPYSVVLVGNFTLPVLPGRCQLEPSPSPSPSPSSTPSPSPSETEIPTPTPTPVAESSPSPSETPSPTPAAGLELFLNVTVERLPGSSDPSPSAFEAQREPFVNALAAALSDPPPPVERSRLSVSAVEAVPRRTPPAARALLQSAALAITVAIEESTEGKSLGQISEYISLNGSRFAESSAAAFAARGFTVTSIRLIPAGCLGRRRSLRAPSCAWVEVSLPPSTGSLPLAPASSNSVPAWVIPVAVVVGILVLALIGLAAYWAWRRWCSGSGSSENTAGKTDGVARNGGVADPDPAFSSI